MDTQVTTGLKRELGKWESGFSIMLMMSGAFLVVGMWFFITHSLFPIGLPVGITGGSTLALGAYVRVDPSMRSQPSGNDRLIAAFADKERLSILKTIANSPKRISQIVEETKLSRPSVCFHLGVLESVGLVSSSYHVLELPDKAPGRTAREYLLNTTRYRQGATILRELLIEELS